MECEGYAVFQGFAELGPPLHDGVSVELEIAGGELDDEVSDPLEPAEDLGGGVLGPGGSVLELRVGLGGERNKVVDGLDDGLEKVEEGRVGLV